MTIHGAIMMDTKEAIIILRRVPRLRISLFCADSFYQVLFGRVMSHFEQRRRVELQCKRICNTKECNAEWKYDRYQILRVSRADWLAARCLVAWLLAT